MNAAARAIALLDLTDLSDGADARAVAALCARAMTPLGPVAAVCVWPRFASAAKAALRGTPVKVATVVNFPAGGSDIAEVEDETRRALVDGADEIDLVLPYGALMTGDRDLPAAMVAAIRRLTPQGRLLKVILETGELNTAALIREATRLAIAAGADFVKTSTGKTAVSATPEAVRLMLEEIAAAARPVGLKVSGGVRTATDALVYMGLAEAAMGPAFLTRERFRFGASGLLDALLGAADTPASGY